MARKSALSLNCRNIISAKAILIKVIEANSYNDAHQKFNDYFDLGPYEPIEE